MPVLARPELDALDVGIYYRVDDLGGRVVRPDGTLEATVYLHNRSAREQTYRGEVASAAGELLLSGDWELYVDTLERGRVIASRALASPGTAEPAAARTLAPGERRTWSFELAAADLADGPANVRLRTRIGEAEDESPLLRLAESLDVPDWIALEYRPGRRSYAPGEPITVHFELRNDGAEDFPYGHGGDYRGATRHLRFAFTGERHDGLRALDPRPSQVCLGGIGSGDIYLAPGDSWRKELPLNAYLAFPEPGVYTVRAFQNLGFGVPVEGLEEAGWPGYVAGGTFEIEITAPDAAAATARIEAILEQGEAHERKRELATLNHPSFLAPLAEGISASEPETAAELVGAIGEIYTVAATESLLALARDRRQKVRVAALRALIARRPVPAGFGADTDPPSFYSSRRLQDRAMALWEALGLTALWGLFEDALASGSAEEAAIAGGGLLSRGEAADVELLAAAADRLAPRLPLSAARRGAVDHLARAAFSFARLYGAPPIAVNQRSTPGRRVLWASMLRPSEAAVDPVGEAVLLDMLRSPETLLRHNAVRWLPDSFGRAAEVPWVELLADDDRDVWWYAVQTAKRLADPRLEPRLRQLLGRTEDPLKRRGLDELLALWQAAPKH